LAGRPGTLAGGSLAGRLVGETTAIQLSDRHDEGNVT